MHFAIAGVDFPVKDEVVKEVKRERLRISLKKFNCEKPQAVKPQPVVEKPIPKPPEKRVKKTVKKTEVKKKIVKKIRKPVKKLKKVEKVQEPVSQPELPKEVVLAKVETKPEPVQEIVQIKKEEPKPEPAFDYEAYMDSVLKLIEGNKSYPYLARKKGQEGVVKINVLVDEEGEILDFGLEKSSGHRLLDKNAKELIASVFPVENKSGEKIRFVIPVRYKLD